MYLEKNSTMLLQLFCPKFLTYVASTSCHSIVINQVVAGSIKQANHTYII
jgi:hypothetical protein